MNIEDLLGEAQLPESVVTLCLAGNLAAEHERLTRIVAEPTSLAGPLDGNAARLAEVREQMRAHEHDFRLRALPASRFKKHRRQIPQAISPEEARADGFLERYHEWTCRLVAECCIDPVMTEAQATQLADKLSDAQWALLSQAAWDVNTETLSIPFSVAGSGPATDSGRPSAPPGPPVPASAGSLAGNASNEPSSNATSTATSLVG